MPLRFLFLFLCARSAALLHAQYDDLLRNPDVSWVAEYTTDFEMNPENKDKLYARRANSLDVIQFHNSGAENGLYGRKVFAKKYLSERIFQEAGRPGNICYRDSLVIVPMTEQAFFKSLHFPNQNAGQRSAY